MSMSVKCYGSTSVSKTESRGSTPCTDAKMNKEELDTIRTAYIRLYGDRWRQQFAKYYWCVYDGADAKIKLNKIKKGVYTTDTIV